MEELRNEEDLKEYLNKRFYTATDLGVSPRNADNWIQNGLINKPASKERIRYNVKDALRIKVIHQLLRFGVSYSNIHKILIQLDVEVDFQKNIDPEMLMAKNLMNSNKADDRFADKDLSNEKMSISIVNDEIAITGDNQELLTQLMSIVTPFNLFEHIIFDIVEERTAGSLLIDQNYNVDYINREILNAKSQEIPKLFHSTHISIDLTKLLSEIIDGKNNRCQLLDLYVLTTEEKEIIENLRNGKNTGAEPEIISKILKSENQTEELLNNLKEEVAELRNQVAGSIHLHKSILSQKETAEYCDLSVDYLYQLTSKGHIPHYKPRGKKIYFKRTELDDWLLQNKFHDIST